MKSGNSTIYSGFSAHISSWDIDYGTNQYFVDHENALKITIDLDVPLLLNVDVLVGKHKRIQFKIARTDLMRAAEALKPF